MTESGWWQRRWLLLAIIVTVIAIACGVVTLTRRHADAPLPDRPTVPGRPDAPMVPSSTGNGAVVPGQN
jgi:hypothetical protein